MKLKDLLRLILEGGPGLVQIAVTNACNARCRFCSFPSVPAHDLVMADPRRLARGLDSLSRRGGHYVTFTGGEPLLYPHLLPALAQARQLGLSSLLITNGALLTARLLKDLHVINTGIAHKEAGIGQLGAGITRAPLECFERAILSL